MSIDTKAGPLIAGMPISSSTITDKVRCALVDIFGNTDARQLAVQHPASLLPKFNDERFWGRNSYDIIAAMQNHLEQNLEGTLINFVTWEPVEEGEADKFGMNLVFSELPDIIIRAGLWAALTRHRKWFSTGDMIAQQTYLEQLFKEDLPHGMKQIIADYEHALEVGDPVARDITARMTNATAMALLGRHGAVLKRTWAEPNYEERVRTFFRQNDIKPRRITANGIDRPEGCCLQLTIAGNGNRVTKWIVVDSCEVSGHDNDVEVIMGPDGTFKNTGTGNDVRVRNWPWKTIAEFLRV